MVFEWYNATIDALMELWRGFLIFVPSLIGALLIFIVGWFVSIAVGKIVAEVLRKVKFNAIFEKGAMKEALQKAEFKVDASGFIGAIIKWVFVIVFLMAAVEVLGLNQFAEFLADVLAYLPNVIVASLILVVAVIIADITEKLTRAAVESVKVGYGRLVGSIVRWSIWIFAIFAILYQLKIAPELIQTLLTGIVALIVIAGGIAFGLGGKDAASAIIKDIKGRFER